MRLASRFPSTTTSLSAAPFPIARQGLGGAIVLALGFGLCVNGAPASGQTGLPMQEKIIEEVIVTGTRIQRANLISSSPIAQVDAQELLLAGITRVEDLLKSMPQLYSLDNSSGANGATGTATLELRGPGASRTLVLVDGRRPTRRVTAPYP